MHEKIFIRAGRIAVCLALFLLTAHAAAAQTAAAAGDRAAIFEQVWTTIGEKYYDAALGGLDWNAVKKKYAARAARAKSETDFYALLDRMAGELRDSHTRVYSPAQRAARRTQRRAVAGLAVRLIEGRPAIFAVLPGSEAESAGVRPGMIVRAVDGVPVARAIEAARRAVGVSSSERATLMRVFSKMLAGEPGTTLALEVTDAAGKTRRFAVPRRTVSDRPQIESRALAAGAGYLKFGRFDESLEPALGAALDELADAPALIVDLRGNGGGDGEMGLRFAGRFLDERTDVARLVTRTGAPPVPGMPMTLEAGEKGGAKFRRPLVVLVDEATASTAELIANALQERGRAYVIGTNTCGCVLAFLDYKPLAGGGELSVSEFGFVTAGGRRLEGAGVAPDRVVRPTLADLRAGRDAALAAAEEYLKLKIQN